MKRLSERQFGAIGKALSDPRRYQILREIASVDTLACQDIRTSHAVSAATISHHLKELEAAGLVTITREGKYAHLRFRGEVMAAYLARVSDTLCLTVENAAAARP